MKNIAILGSTGSIGRSALSLIDLYPERFQVVALAAQDNAALIAEQARKYRPRLIALEDRESARALASRLSGIPVLEGTEGVREAACQEDADLVLAAISGAAGLLPTFEALRCGKHVALANKETLVMAGELIMPVVREQNLQLLPVDSEHSALHQCLRGAEREDVRRLVLTASGGPFHGSTRQNLESVTVQQALAHPTWRMGKKITIDSATLMNKGLEVIEAHHFFNVSGDQISIVIHPQSVVHSMVEFVDGSVLAQLSITDMRAALLYAFSFPERTASKLPMLDLYSLKSLEFSAPDLECFPCIGLAYRALEAGGSYPAALNAANEVAVASFLEENIAFSAIPEIIASVLEAHSPVRLGSLNDVLEIDRTSRQAARQRIGQPARFF